MYNKETIQLIKEKLADVADYFVDKYNDTVSEFANIEEAYSFIDNYSKQVILEGYQFTINDLIPYASHNLEDAKLKGAVLNTPKAYKKLYINMLEEWEPTAHDTYNSIWKKKNLHYDFFRTPNSWGELLQKIRVSPGLAGNVKEFLREKYGKNTIYVQKLADTKLGAYRALLLLDQNKKSEWRALITEYQLIREGLWNTWKDETNVVNTKAFKKWETKKKATQKANRKKGITNGKHQVLNKQKGEITLHIARSHKYDYVAVFDKKTQKIADLDKLGKLSILLDKDWLEKKEELYKWLRFKQVQFIYVGERERKYVNNKHIISMEEFKKSKPFARLATSCLAENVLRALPGNEDLIYEAFPKYEELKEKVKEYYEAADYLVDDELHPVILEEATEFNNWDFNIYSDILEFQKIIRKFGFIDLIKDEWKQSIEQKRIAKNMLYILLKHQKINHALLDEMELVDKIPIEIYTKEEAKLEIINT